MLKSHFDIDEQGHLVIGEISAVELADRFGTPLYVMDEQRIRENCQRFYQAYAKLWKNVMVCYAYKANSNTAICKILESEGSGAEVSSECELRVALQIGVPGQRTIFNGNYKSRQELELAITNDVLINLDTIQELHIVDGLASKLNHRARIGFRINPDVRTPTHPYIATGLRESKFGLDMASGRALEGYRAASQMKNVEIVGVHTHIGSQILDTRPFEEAVGKIMELVGQIKKELGIALELIDLGGGLGIPYKPEEKELPPEKFASKVVSAFRKAVETHELGEPTLALEPGRYLVADAGIILGRVGYVKKRQDSPTWIAIDAGMNALVRPAMYDAYHHIEAANKMRDEHTELVNVAGPLCESGDFLGKKRHLPRLERGDLLAVFDTGAYGLSMSSQHTAKPRPAMVLVNSGKAEVVRTRESCDDLTRLDQVPAWLK